MNTPLIERERFTKPNTETRFREITKGLKDIAVPLKKEPKHLKTILEKDHGTGIMAITQIWK